jgi:micrococcal nuclease
MYEYKAKLIRVVDGDTYDLEIDLGFKVRRTDRFRLVGADTPEVFGKNASEEGRQASESVKRLLWAQPSITIRTLKDKQGKYGRYLADIRITHNGDGDPLPDTVWLSQYLIDQGIATPL